MIKKLRVSFGNPALGTYSGLVSILEKEYIHGEIADKKSDFPHNGLGGESVTSCIAAMVRVPPDQVPEGILTLARAHRRFFRHVRIVTITSDGDEFVEQHSADNQQQLFQDTIETSNLASKLSMSYLILFELDSPEAAQIFVQDLHGKPYTSLQPEEKCEVFHVARAQGDDGLCIMSPFFAASYSDLRSSHEDSTDITTAALPSSPLSTSVGVNILGSPSSTSTMELQNCAVCLEVMNPSTESILTTVCNHSFHFDCLLRWQDSPCPVCRYDHSSLNETLSQCHICGTTYNNYVCLICGVVSCGGGVHNSLACLSSCSASDDDDDVLLSTTSSIHQPSGHARLHYEQTLHAYALETGTQHVWDFAGDGYVHRLIRNSGDGKLVEVNDPWNTNSHERTLSPGLSDAQEEHLMHRKLECSANQYYTLLKSQLEQQRIYYEGRLAEMRQEYEQKRKKSSAADLVIALKQERHQLEQRCLTLQRKNKKASEEVAFLKSMSESLLQNKSLMDQQITVAQKERAKAQEMIQSLLPPLESKVTTLMQQLDGFTLGSELEDTLGFKPKAKK